MENDPKILALRQSIIGDEKVVDPYEPKVVEAPIEKVEDPIGIQKLKANLNRKQIPYVLIYLTGDGDNRHASFDTTIVHPRGADLIHGIIEANRAAFWPSDKIEHITGSGTDQA